MLGVARPTDGRLHIYSDGQAPSIASGTPEPTPSNSPGAGDRTPTTQHHDGLLLHHGTAPPLECLAAEHAQTPIELVEYGFALSKLRPETLTLVALPGGGVGRGSGYQGEQLTSVGRGFITQLNAGKADAYLRAHPNLVVKR